jgi:hypothetical protein
MRGLRVRHRRAALWLGSIAEESQSPRSAGLVGSGLRLTGVLPSCRFKWRSIQLILPVRLALIRRELPQRERDWNHATNLSNTNSHCRRRLKPFICCVDFHARNRRYFRQCRIRSNAGWRSWPCVWTVDAAAWHGDGACDERNRIPNEPSGPVLKQDRVSCFRANTAALL